MSSLKAGAMLSLFSDLSFVGTHRAANNEAPSYDQYAAAEKPVVADKSAPARREARGSSNHVVAQASGLMPQVLRAAFCGH